jgi:hypothetical protein
MVDATAGAALALILMTAANAALPEVKRLALAPAAPARRPAAPTKARRAAPPLAPVLVAFQDPIPGYPIISPFGLRKLPWEEGGRLHAGVDIAAPAGLPVLAAADGVVTRVDSDSGYGRFVEVKHAAGLSTRYAHLGRFLPQIAPGVAVKAGFAVGQIGSTGSSTGAHLHFEIRDDQDRPLNPELFLGRRFAAMRDLPLRAALRIPRGVRVAYVSNIPKVKREAMQAKLDEEAQAAAAEAAAEAGSVRSTQVAANAADSGVNASVAARGLNFVGGRPRARLIARN